MGKKRGKGKARSTHDRDSGAAGVNTMWHDVRVELDITAPVTPPQHPLEGGGGSSAGDSLHRRGKAAAAAHGTHDITMRVDDCHMIYVADDILTRHEAAQWIAFAEDRGFERCDSAATSVRAHRHQGRLGFDDPAVAAAIFARITPLLAASQSLDRIDGRRAVGCASNIRLYRYTVGDSFGPHIDQSSVTAGGVSRLTLLIYLSGGSDIAARASVGPTGESKAVVACSAEVRGGATVFYKGHGKQVLAAVEPRCGRLLLHGRWRLRGRPPASCHHQCRRRVGCSSCSFPLPPSHCSHPSFRFRRRAWCTMFDARSRRGHHRDQVCAENGRALRLTHFAGMF